MFFTGAPRTLLLTLSLAAAAPAIACDMWNPPAQTDTPDAAFIDTNGDGIDGMRCGPIFVAPSGNDKSVGTIESPMRTISAAMLAAYQMTPKRDVYVSSEGTYNETLWLQPEINVYGGYNHTNGWSRSSKRAIVQGGIVGAWAWPTPIAFPGQVIHSLDIRAQSNTGPGGHSVGLVIDGTGLMTFENSAIRSGNGGAGINGTAGTNGAAGGNGPKGQDGDPDSTIVAPWLGDGGMGAYNGGSGGGGGSGAGNGWRGEIGKGPSGGAGGTGGAWGDPGKAGSNGLSGASGANAAHGAGGTEWYLSGGYGTAGQHGSGGGGGGGGGGQSCLFCVNGHGNGGGGGGGGGYRGTGALGGTFGGSSIGVLARGTGGYVFQASTALYAGNAGRGGNGGRGGTGGQGGAGGQGGTVALGEIGRGGNGGPGGNGGNGGHGGGGAGGSSIVVMAEGGLISNIRNDWYPGALGVGGSTSPGGNPGIGGITTKYHHVPASAVKIDLGTGFAPLVTHARMTAPAGPLAVVAQPEFGHPDRPTSFTLQILTQPANGTATAGGKNLTYQPAAGFSGWDTFSYRLTAGGQSVTGWASVYVSPPILTMADAVTALRIAGGLKTRVAADAHLDVTGDTHVTVADALHILRNM
jgi:hypothetical protein